MVASKDLQCALGRSLKAVMMMGPMLIQTGFEASYRRGINSIIWKFIPEVINSFREKWLADKIMTPTLFSTCNNYHESLGNPQGKGGRGRCCKNHESTCIPWSYPLFTICWTWIVILSTPISPDNHAIWLSNLTAWSLVAVLWTLPISFLSRLYIGWTTWWLYSKCGLTSALYN